MAGAAPGHLRRLAVRKKGTDFTAQYEPMRGSITKRRTIDGSVWLRISSSYRINRFLSFFWVHISSPSSLMHLYHICPYDNRQKGFCHIVYVVDDDDEIR